jgi:replicative DNA helicase
MSEQDELFREKRFERKLISCLTDSAAMTRVWELGLRKEVFTEPVNESIFDFILKYWYAEQMQKVPTKDILEYEFPGVELYGTVEESLTFLVEELQKRYATNKLQNIVRDAAMTSEEDPLGTLKRLFGASYNASESIVPRFARSNMATSVEQRRLRYLTRQEQESTGTTLGFPLLDAHTNGLRPGELCAVGAFSKVGKTMFLANAAIQARKQGGTPLFITLEMSKEEIEDRLDAIFSEVSYNRLTHGELTPQEAMALRTAQDELAQLGSLYIERPMEGERTVPHIVSRARQIGADYLIIDQLSFMEPINEHRDLTSKHAEIVASLKKEIARDSAGQIPCLMAVQLNRASLNQPEGVGLQNFANTSVIEQTVDLALGLSRSRDERANRLMRLDILGARRSETQAWMLRWELINETKLEIMGEAQ